MTELLVSIILALCPTDGVDTTECMEDVVNCAVQEAGRIDEHTIKTCIEKYWERENG